MRRIEEEILLRLDCRGHVIATGGSAVYNAAAREHLKAQGVIVFFHVDMPMPRSKVRDYDTRGLAKRPDQSLDDLFLECSALYREDADVTVDCIGLTREEVCAEIIGELERKTQAGSFPRRESGSSEDRRNIV